MIYPDTAVLAVYYCPEPLSGRAQRALQEAGQLAISPLLVYLLRGLFAVLGQTTP